MWWKAIVVVTVLALSAINVLAQEITFDHIGNIPLPETLITIQTQDMNRDSLAEIIVSTDHHILVYSQTGHIPDYGLSWTSPPLIRHRGLMVQDIDGDSLADIALSDSLHIYLLDPWNNDTIWTSPQLDGTFMIFTVGDRNNDGESDVLTVRKEPFIRDGDWQNFDTTWVDIYDGPVFHLQPGTIVLVRYAYTQDQTCWRFFREVPSKLEVKTISGNDGLSTKLLLYTKYHYSLHCSSHANLYSEWEGSGLLNLIDPQNFNCHQDSIGELKGEYISNVNNRLYTKAIAFKYYGSQTLYRGWQRETYYLNTISSDSVINNIQIWQRNIVDWMSYFIGESRLDIFGPELAFTVEDSICLYSLESGSYLWQSRDNERVYIMSFYHNPALFSNSQIILHNTHIPWDYHFFDSFTGILTTTLPSRSIPITAVADLDNDGTDEILSASGLNLDIYGLLNLTGTGEVGVAPEEYVLLSAYPNPFNARTLIDYTLTGPARVSLEIYDILGRKLVTLDEGDRVAGSYQATWDASHLSSGVYFCKLATDSRKTVEKLLLIR